MSTLANPVSPSSERHFIIGTAGHIDHGKTTLVKALTGINPDRLPEEQRRGMTIDLGFADLTVGDFHFGIVDVPGHERFVKTMVAGATGIDLAMLVVAADDSVMPQTVEHIEILRLLGIERVIGVITKIDAVAADLVELVQVEVAELLESAGYHKPLICRVSSHSGAGLEALKQTLVQAAGSMERKNSPVPFRMCIDRVFTVQGRGTVVTGSALRGAVAKGDVLELLPAKVSVRVRDLQTHGHARDVLQSGQRAAINLAGIDKESLQRGCEVATPGYLAPSHMVDVQLEVLGAYSRALKSPFHARLQIGTSDIPVRVVLHEGTKAEPGASVFAQLRSGEPILSTFKQRFILRDQNAADTIGGGIILRPSARRRRAGIDEITSLKRLRDGTPADRLDEVLRRMGFHHPSELQICALAGIEIEDQPRVFEELVQGGRWTALAGTDVYVAVAALEDLAGRLVHWLERYHQAHPELPGRPLDAVVGWLERMSGNKTVARPVYEEFLRAGKIKSLGRFVCAPSFAPALSSADEKFLAQMLREIERGAFQPPTLGELSFASQVDKKRLERLATLAVALGELVQIDAAIYLHASREKRMKETVAKLVAHSGGVTVAQIREALGTSRKYAVPFVEYLDRIGFTRRTGDLRVLA